jgi:hypothetical protein
MKKILFLILGVFLFGGIYKYNGKTYKYKVIDTVDIICDKEIKKKSFICCKRRFFSFEDMEKFIVTGKIPDYSHIFNVDCRGYKGNVKEFKEALKNGNFEKAKKLLQKEKSLAKYGYYVVLERKDYKKVAELLKPYADVPDKVLIELANKAEFEKLDYFVKDKKAFARKHMYQFKNSKFMKHYGFKALDFFTKKQIDSMYGYAIERLIQIFDDDYLKGAWCLNALRYIGAYKKEEIKQHKNYCKYLPKSTIFYKVIFEKERAIKELEKVKYKNWTLDKNYELGPILINLYLINGQKKKAKKLYKKILSRCDNLFDRIVSNILVATIGRWILEHPSSYSHKKECMGILERQIRRNYKWISVFYDYKLDLKDFK